MLSASSASASLGGCGGGGDVAGRQVHALWDAAGLFGGLAGAGDRRCDFAGGLLDAKGGALGFFRGFLGGVYGGIDAAGGFGDAFGGLAYFVRGGLRGPHDFLAALAGVLDSTQDLSACCCISALAQFAGGLGFAGLDQRFVDGRFSLLADFVTGFDDGGL